MPAPCLMWLQRFKSLLSKPCWRDDACVIFVSHSYRELVGDPCSKAGLH